MKIVIFLTILLVLASSQCPGYKSSDACFNVGNLSTSYGWGRIVGCQTYNADPPDTCATPIDGYSIDTAKTTCSVNKSYQHFVSFPNTGTEEVKCLSYPQQLAVFQADFTFTTKFSWADYSCIDANKQMICNCKPGFVFVAGTATYGSCSTCGTNCTACLATDPLKCTACNAKSFLDTQTCTECDANATACKSKTTASACQPHYYLDATTSKCVQCPDANSYCTSATAYQSCKIGYWNDTTTAKKCVACGSNVAICTGSTDATITECNPPDATNVFFKISGSGCFGVAAASKCKTANAAGKCLTCFTGYTWSAGVCKLCIDAGFHGTLKSGDTAAKAIQKCTDGADVSTAATPVCLDGYYEASKKCEACKTGCKKCTGDSSGAGNATKCVAGSIDTGYSNFAGEIKSCDQTNYTGCATCNDGVSPANNNCLSMKTDSGFGIKADFQTTKCSNTANDCLVCTINQTDATKSTCTKFTAGKCAKSAAQTDTLIATEYIVCAKTNFATCTCWSNAEVLTSCASAFTLQTEGTTVTCEAEGGANFKNCLVGTKSGATLTCTKCKDDHSITTGACVACSPAGQWVKADSSACVVKVTNCKSGKASLVSDVAKCSECDTDYIVNAAQTACHKCGDLGNYSAACKTTGLSTAGTACVCTDCSKTAGYYLKAADGSCISTAITNCKTATIDGKTITCNICDFGYKWDTATSACLVCNQTTNKCATTGCASLDYPGKASAAGTTTAAANSALLKVIFGLLIAIITLLI